MSTHKPCSGPCKKLLSLADFGRNKTKKTGFDEYCRVCRKAYNAAYYERTKERHNPGRYARRRAAHEEIRRLLHDYMADKSCVDCGETDIVVLEFDHQRDKVADVSALLRNKVSWPRILEEIEKCEVVCANDHRRRTAATFRWRKGR